MAMTATAVCLSIVSLANQLNKDLNKDNFIATPVFQYSIDDWDRNRARCAVGEGFPFLLFRLLDGFTVPPWLTVPEAPL